MPKKIISLIFIISILLIISCGNDKNDQNKSNNRGVRAGIDLEVEVTENSNTQIVVLDLGSYMFKNNETYFQLQSVNFDEVHADLIFMKKSDFNPTYSGPKIDYEKLIKDDKNVFNVRYRQVFRIKKGQTVLLDDENIKIKLIDILGHGCPQGMQC